MAFRGRSGREALLFPHYLDRMSRPLIAELVQGCQRGEASAQAALYDLVKGKMMGICLRYCRTTAEAEDIFQEAFVKLFGQIHTLRQPESAMNWIRALVIRTAISHYRQGGHERQQLGYQAAEETTESFDVLDALSLQEITRLIQALPDRCRLVVNLYLMDGYEHQEIADLLQITVGTSKSQLWRGKELLRKSLLNNGLMRHGN